MNRNHHLLVDVKHGILTPMRKNVTLECYQYETTVITIEVTNDSERINLDGYKIIMTLQNEQGKENIIASGVDVEDSAIEFTIVHATIGTKSAEVVLYKNNERLTLSSFQFVIKPSIQEPETDVVFDIPTIKDIIKKPSIVIPEPPQSVDSIAQLTTAYLWNEIASGHQAKPHGVPSYFDWFNAPRSQTSEADGFTSAMSSTYWQSYAFWGQVYQEHGIDSTPTTCPNTRVQIRNFNIYLQLKNGSWIHSGIANDYFEGALYTEDFQGDYNKLNTTIRQELTGGISFKIPPSSEKATVKHPNSSDFQSYCHHFFTKRTTNAQTGNLKNVFASIEMRLILDNPAGIDDRSNAKYTANIGLDLWQNPASNWSDPGSHKGFNNTGMYRLTNNWRTHVFHLAKTKALLDIEPPPGVTVT